MKANARSNINFESALTGNNFPIIAAIPGNVRSVLDVGMGCGTWGAMISDWRRPERLVGLEIWEPYIEHARRHLFYDTIHRLDLEKESLPFRSEEFDCTVCLEVMEHLTKGAGLRLIAEMKRVSKRLIITTPNGFHKQIALDGNPKQEHLSGWSVGELRALGFKVRGIGHFTPLGIQLRKPIDMSYLLGSLTWIMPRNSLGLMAIWNGLS